MLVIAKRQNAVINWRNSVSAISINCYVGLLIFKVLIALQDLGLLIQGSSCSRHHTQLFATGASWLTGATHVPEAIENARAIIISSWFPPCLLSRGDEREASEPGKYSGDRS